MTHMLDQNNNITSRNQAQLLKMTVHSTSNGPMITHPCIDPQLQRWRSLSSLQTLVLIKFPFNPYHHMACNMHLEISKLTTAFHWSTISNSGTDTSFVNTCNSTWSLYEKYYNFSLVTLKVNTKSKSYANFSTIVFPTRDCFIYAHLEWYELHRKNLSWYYFCENMPPFYS